MASPLIESKLHLPQLRERLVQRPRLRRGVDSRLTVISAPAGFGKTTLLAAWMADATTEERSVAWLSLDEGDNRPETYWTYLITALQNAIPGIGTSALPMLQSSEARIQTILTTVLNELSAVEYDVDIVLDDYHLVDGPEIHAGMAFLLEHLPPHVHLVIGTRADPDLPLPRLRARGELVEIRAADLRFTLDEVATYLNETVGLDLAAGDIAVLEGRTEGWIAALQLAGLSMQGRDDVATFIAGFAGDDRYIVDYLVDEVLGRQPEPVRQFLIRTSVLDRLSGALCDAVTGQRDGKAMLQALDRGNLFMVPLDDNRRWYRYHHLFADVLHTHLLDDHPEQVAELHRRASEWYEQQGMLTPAVRHALVSGDVDRAAGLIELAIPALLRDRQEATLRGWIDAIPAELVRARPVLAVGFIGALMSSGEFEGIEARLQDVEQSLEAGGTTVVDEEEFPRLPGAIETYRAALALAQGDIEPALTHAQSAIDHAADRDHLIRASASAIQGLAYWSRGDLEDAHRRYTVCVEGLQRVGHVADVLGCSITLADIRITQGRLTDALRTYEQALQLAKPGPPLRGTADMYVGMSQIACERGDLKTATQHLQHARELGEHTWLPQNPYRWRVAMARVRQAEGDLPAAVALLDEADRLYVGDFAPNVRPVPATRARVWIAQGRLAEARAWARERGLSADDDLSYLREYEHLTLARLLMADSPAEAAVLLERLLTAAEDGGRTGSVIEILILQALVQHSKAPLERASQLAEPEGYVRKFIDEGQPVTPHQGLIEPLSARELDVLRLLRSDLGGPEIARELVLSLHTVRTHTKNIYAKLGVNNRRAAVRRAEELNL